MSAPRKVTAMVIDPKDNVATIIGELKAGQTVTATVGRKSRRVKSKTDVPFGHKVAIARIKKGEPVLKYGASIGSATEDIEVGDYVHVHNIESNRGRGDLAAQQQGKE